MPAPTITPRSRRYSFLIDGALYAPADLNDLPEWVVYNPSNLKRDACKLALHVSRELGVEVDVIKHLKGEGDRHEATYNYAKGWVR